MSEIDALGIETEKAVLDALNEPKTAADLCDVTGLSDPTIYRILHRLEAADLVGVYGSENGETGRPAKTWIRTVDLISIDLDGERQPTGLFRFTDDAEPSKPV